MNTYQEINLFLRLIKVMGASNKGKLLKGSAVEKRLRTIGLEFYV